MDVVYTVYAGILGLVLGSFYNVVGLRVPKGESIVHPPSHCTSCGKRLRLLELIPILSYVMQGGKCRGCHVRISPIYMVTEFVTGVLFAYATWRLGVSAELFVVLAFISLLVIINVSDFAYMLIPNKVLLFFLPLLVVGRILSPLEPWWDSALGAVIGFGILFVIAIVSKGGMGGGDIKLFFLIGLVVGTMQTLLILFVASFIGMIVGFVVLKVRGQGRKTPIPFGPSIALASVIVYFWGDAMMSYYVNLF